MSKKLLYYNPLVYEDYLLRLEAKEKKRTELSAQCQSRDGGAPFHLPPINLHRPIANPKKQKGFFS